MARRAEVHAFLRISLEMTIANLSDAGRFAAHPWPGRKDLEAEIERRGEEGELTPGKWVRFWKSWDDFRLDQINYALVTARLWEIPTAPARLLHADLGKVLAGRVRFSALVTKVAHLDDRLRHRTAIPFLLQSAPVLDASCREAAQEVHREFFRRNFELWLSAFSEVFEVLGFSAEDGDVRDLSSQLIAVADGLADRIARTGDDSYLYSANGSSLLGKTALQLFWSTINAKGAPIEELVDNEVILRMPNPTEEWLTEEDQ
ncbi:hypothetical protein GCM10009838_68160 [Catenulispora subtropica]|uniref:Uncharacterized protein n=2 Tax=Catenulispora subtropica TaxID=450798 RepID=A0ABN2SXD8_9ACTN